MVNPEKTEANEVAPVRVVGRYLVSRSIARGGMASVHLAKLHGDEGFSRVVAAKRLHEQFAEDDAFVRMFLEEARIASKIQHPNVVPVLDVLRSDGEVILIQDYVHGVPLDRLLARTRDSDSPIPIDIAIGILVPALHGLHAAHESSDEFGKALNVVHRDVSPQNILMSTDGIPRLIDFGIAKASSTMQETQAGLFKGKVAYMSSEQLRGEKTDRRTDIYAAGMTLWEILAGRRAYAGVAEGKVYSAVLSGQVPSLKEATQARELSPADRGHLDALIAIVHRALALDPNERYQTAADFAEALISIKQPASAKALSRWVKDVGADYLTKREALVAAAFSANSTIDEVSSVRSGVSAVQKGVEEPTSSVSSVGAAQALSTDSQVSVVDSVVAGTKRWGLAVALLVSLLVIAGLVGFLMRSKGDPQVQERALATPVAPPGSANASATTEVSVPVSSARATTAALPSASAAVPSPPSLAGGARGATYRVPAPPVHVATPPSASAPPARATQSADCNPPFYYEGTRKVFKPHCVQ